MIIESAFRISLWSATNVSDVSLVYKLEQYCAIFIKEEEEEEKIKKESKSTIVGHIYSNGLLAYGL